MKWPVSKWAKWQGQLKRRADPAPSSEESNESFVNRTGKKPEACRGCPFFFNEPAPVWGKGPTSGLVVIGELPARAEYKEGLSPGEAPSPIRIAGSAIRAKPASDFYYTYACKCRPSKHTAEEARLATMHCYQHILRHELNELQVAGVNCILALGQKVMDLLFGDGGKRDITSYRGGIVEIDV